MSLLMEALRWAEEAKSKVEEEAAEDTLSSSGGSIPTAKGSISTPAADGSLSTPAAEGSISTLVDSSPAPHLEGPIAPPVQSEDISTPPIPDPVAVATDQAVKQDKQDKIEPAKIYPQISPVINKKSLATEEIVPLKDSELSEVASKEPLPSVEVSPTLKPVSKKSSPEFQDHKPAINALFQAKRATQQQKMRKMNKIAALLLILPLGIGLYLYYSTSLDKQIQLSSSAKLSDASSYGESTAQANLSNPASVDVLPIIIEQTTSSLAKEVTQVESTVRSVEGAALSGDEIALSENEIALSENKIALSENVPSLNEENLPLRNIDSSLAIEETGAKKPSEPSVLASKPTTLSTQPAEPTDTPSPLEDSANSPAISFIRKPEETALNAELNIAYENYQDGNYEMALHQYQEILNVRPIDRNAMLGLASVYAKQNRTALAQNMYSRLLKLNPKDPLARAGLIDLTKTIDPVYQESELKALLELHPDVAPLAFALGNLYASQNRWNEAQSAYFDASMSAKSSNTGPISPDYPFNLAVSLERLNQLRPAYDYYREALEFSRYSVPGFDPALLNSRLEYLERTLQ